MNERRSINATGVACLIVALLPGVLYVGGYFALSRNHPGATPDDRCRVFRQQWQMKIYKPAAKVESAVTGDDVTAYWMP